MEFILLSDCHLCAERPIARLDADILDTCIGKLEQVFMFAHKNKINSIVQSGDLFDIKRSWKLLSAMTIFLEKWKRKGICLYAVTGQHDMFYHSLTNEKTIFGILVSSGLIIKLSDTPILFKNGNNIISIYGASFGEDIPKPSHQYRSILVCHRQILMNKIYKQQEQYDYAPAFSEQHSEYDLILTGDAHQKYDFKLGGRHICNAGPMMRLEATDAMLNHMPGFYIFDSNKNKLSYEYIPAKKGSEVLSKSHIELQKIRKHNFDDFIDKVKAGDQNQSLDFNENLQVVIQQSKASEQVKYHIGEYLAKGERT